MNSTQWIDLLAVYHSQLDALRGEWGQVFDLPPIPFFLFGMGGRRKMIYRGGALIDALTGDRLRQWEVREEWIVPPAYTVGIETQKGERVEIVEDEEAVWLVERGDRRALTGEEAVCLPDFAGHPYGLVLRVLHQEILVNITGGLPVPNFFVYPRPWYRDAAMMAMVLRETGNLGLIRAWALGLVDPYDHNNGNDEPDNLGQALFLISLFGDAHHPLVARILAETPRFQEGDHIAGITDFGRHAVYQTQWLKFGLCSLGLPDAYSIPQETDGYAALCWWGERFDPIDRERAIFEDYPYLTWAADNFLGEKSGPVGNRDYPLTWEANASQANYTGVACVSEEYTKRKLAAPHTWHAAEMFLRLHQGGNNK